MSRVLYVGTKNFSSWSLRAWLALREQNVPFEERLLDLRMPARPHALATIAAISPSRTVPVLVDGNAAIFDSLAIMEYASEMGDASLLPVDARLRAHARSLVAWVHAGLSNLCSTLSFASTFHRAPEPASATEREESKQIIITWSAELDRHGGPYLVGDLSLADIAFVPLVRRLLKRGITLDRWPLAAQWAQRLMARPAVVEWMLAAEALPPVPDE